MLLFGHIGLTIGIFFVLGVLYPDIKPSIKYGYVAIGSLLPDLIDKPIGRILLADSIANGRIYAHTLIFFIILLIASLYIYKTRNDTKMLIISGASFCHLIEDQMWTHPASLLWPLYGWRFPYDPSYENGLEYLLTMLTQSFTLDISNFFNAEFIGFTAILLLMLGKIRRN